MLTKRMAILVLLLVLPLLAFAQDMSGGQGGSMVPFGPGLYRASEGINVAISNEAGDISGQVRDIIINRNGEMRYVVASIDQGAQMEDTDGAEAAAYLIPMERVTFDVGEGEFHFDFGADELANLMRVENDSLPAELNANRTAPSISTSPDTKDPSGTMAPYGSRPGSGTSASVATSPDTKDPTGTARRDALLSGRHIFLSSLLDSEFTNLQGEDLGRVEDVVINVPQTRVEYLAVSTTGGLGLGDRYFAVPMRVLIDADADVQQVVLDVRQEDFRGSAGFPASGAWPGVGDQDFGSVGDDPFDVLDTGPN